MKRNGDQLAIPARSLGHFLFASVLLLAATFTLVVGGTEPDAASPLVSYQYLDSLAEVPLQPNVVSPLVSYQYFDWLGDENLSFQNSSTVSYSFDGTPVIMASPNDQIAPTGGGVVVNVQAAINPPFTYQWRKNGINIAGKTSATLTLSNVQTSDSGLYSVVVGNGFSSVTSTAAKVSVYPGPPPQSIPLPTISTTTAGSTPATRLTAMTTPPSATGALYAFNGNQGTFGAGTLDPNKPTVVLTHGWNSSPEEWPKTVAQALVRRGYNLNIVAWNWVVNATINVLDPAPSAGPTRAEGEALAKALLARLGPSYHHQLHFIGHSLGTMVNCAAADYLHGDGTSVPVKDSGAYLPSNTSLTLLDEAKLVTLVKGLHIFADMLRAGSGGLLGDTQAAANDGAYMVRHLWSKVIPTRHGFIDNYISEVGLLHKEAVNVMLFRAAILDDPIAAHGEAYQWYASTIEDSRAATIGYNWSLTTPPSPNSYFNQSFVPAQTEFTLDQMTPYDAWSLRGQHFVVYPTLMAVQKVTDYGVATNGVVLSVAQAAGVASVSFVSSVLSAPDGNPVYLNTAGSSPAYFVPSTLPTQPSQARWSLQMNLQPAAPSSLNSNSTKMADGSSAPPTAGANASFVVMPVHVPLEAIGMAFEYQISGAANGDFMTMCIGDKNMYAMEAAYVDNGEWNGTPTFQISDYRDHDVDLTFTLNGVSSPSVGTLAVRNIQFFVPQKPTIEVNRAGSQTVVSWPLSGIDWTLETTTDLATPGSWVPILGQPTDIDYSHTMNFDLPGQRQFFRLRKTTAP